MDENNELAMCPLCDGRAELKRVGVRFDPTVRIYSCEACDLDFQYPMPTEAELEAYYRDYYYRDEFKEPPAPERFGGEVPEARQRVTRLRSLLNKKVSLLEVGAGSGAFSDAARPLVGDVAVVEPDEDSRKWIRDDLRIPAYGSIADAAEEGKRYDVICLFHVLEHIADPRAFLRGLSDRLADGGALVVEVPNVNDALNRRYEISGFADHYYQKPHLWYFSDRSLRRVFEHAGLAVEIRNVQRYDLSNHLIWMRDGRPSGLNAFSDIIGPSADAVYADSLIRSGCADTLWAVASQLHQ